MTGHDSTNLALLADYHRLNDTRWRAEKRLGDAFHVVGEAEFPELLIAKVQSVADLVDSFFLGSIEDSSVERSWLEEVADLVARFEKIRIASMRLDRSESARNSAQGMRRHASSTLSVTKVVIGCPSRSKVRISDFALWSNAAAVEAGKKSRMTR